MENNGGQMKHCRDFVAIIIIIIIMVFVVI